MSIEGISRISQTTSVVGTYGYADPEYIATGRLTNKSDIYSFGMLLLNVVSCKKVMDSTDDGLYRLNEHALKLQRKGRLTELIDPRLFFFEGFNSRSTIKIIKTALRCINPKSERRPSASQGVTSVSHAFIRRRDSHPLVESHINHIYAS